MPYTRPQREEGRRAPRREGVHTTYLPLIPRVRQWKDREKVVPFTVFPSYVFCRFDAEDHRDVVTTPGVVAVLSHGGEPAVIPDDELENVRRFVDAVATTGQEPQPVREFEEGQGCGSSPGPSAVDGHAGSYHLVGRDFARHRRTGGPGGRKWGISRPAVSTPGPAPRERLSYHIPDSSR